MTMQKAAERAAELANAAPIESGVWTADEILQGSSPERAFVQFIADADAAAREVLVELVYHGYTHGHPARKALSPFILPDDVDPLLIEARKLAAEVYTAHSGQILDGVWDDTEQVQRNLKALRRGIEIAEARK